MISPNLLLSALWCSETANARLVFVTLLLKVDDEGYWEAADSALANQAGVGLDETREILARLELEDPHEIKRGPRVHRLGAGFGIRNLDYWRGDTPKRKRLSVADREAIIARDGWMCGICGEEIAQESEIEIDHIVPVSQGGDNDHDNLQVAHSYCNRRKGPRLLEPVA